MKRFHSHALVGIILVILVCGFWFITGKTRIHPDNSPVQDAATSNQPLAFAADKPASGTTPMPATANTREEAFKKSRAAQKGGVAADANDRSGDKLGSASAELDHLLAGRSVPIRAHGTVGSYRLALDELFVPWDGDPLQIRKIAPRKDARELLDFVRQMHGEGRGWPGLVFYPESAAGDPKQREILTEQILIQHTNRAQALNALRVAGLELVKEPDFAPGHMVAEARAGGPEQALAAMETLRNQPSITAVEALLLRKLVPALVPDDPFFADQWHLENTGQGGGQRRIDCNVINVWDSFQGSGVRIAIVDDGLDVTHPDLVSNIDTINDFDWNGNDTDPSPTLFSDFHGTAVGGVAAARGNNAIGVSGVAPMATLVGFRLIAGFSSDLDQAEAMTLSNDIIQIKNNSWSYSAGASQLGTAGALFTAAKQTATTTGRGGLGTILVWSAGNGRGSGQQGNKDGATNSMFNLTVGALANTGALASYSETGSHIVCVGPSNGGTRSKVTTDLQGAFGYNFGGPSDLGDLDYTNTFGGTSSAAPAVAGVVALMLEANPNLNWRDVKEILLRSCTIVDQSSPGWVGRPGRSTSLNPIRHNESYGGGLVNASRAVNAAQSWTSLGTMITQTKSVTVNTAIPDNDTIGVVANLDFSGEAALAVEHVTVTVNIQHEYRGDLEITIRSPSGITSTLASEELNDSGTTGYPNWTFSSVRHWGEGSRGTWRVTCRDLVGQDVGIFEDVTVAIHGTSFPAPTITSQPQSVLVAEGQPFSLNATVTGNGLSSVWRRDGTAVDYSGTTYNVAAATLTNAGEHRLVVSNLSGSATSNAAAVGVVNRTVASTTVKEGGTFKFTAKTGGTGLTYQWFLGAVALADDARISGAQSPVLMVKDISGADAGQYTCRVNMGAMQITTQPALGAVLFKPVIQPFILADGVVSGLVNQPLAVMNGATKYKATGLPPGVKIDPKTATLSGRPTKAGTYMVSITAINTVGTSDPVSFTWIVEEFPVKALGVFAGLCDAGMQGFGTITNGGGGLFSMAVTGSGTLSAKLTLTGKTYSQTSFLNALPGGASPAGTLVFKRMPTFSNLTFDYSINLATGVLTGTLTDGSETVGVTAFRSQWGKTLPATLYEGLFNSELALPLPVVGNPAFPQGNGFLSLVIKKTGLAQWTGSLSDGSKVTFATTVAEGGQVPFHLPLYSGTGSAQGWTMITSATGFLDGAVSWFKQPQSNLALTRSYAAGFAAHTLTVTGSRYPKPADVFAMLLLGAPPNNASANFGVPSLPTPFAQIFDISTRGVVKIPTNARMLTFKIDKATGLVTGSFKLQDPDPTDLVPPVATLTRTVGFSALLVPRLNRASGHYLLPDLPALGPPLTTIKSSPITSGPVQLRAAP